MELSETVRYIIAYGVGIVYLSYMKTNRSFSHHHCYHIYSFSYTSHPYIYYPLITSIGKIRGPTACLVSAFACKYPSDVPQLPNRTHPHSTRPWHRISARQDRTDQLEIGKTESTARTARIIPPWMHFRYHRRRQGLPTECQESLLFNATNYYYHFFA